MLVKELDVLESDGHVVIRWFLISVLFSFTDLGFDCAEPQDVVGTSFGFGDGGCVCKELRSALGTEDNGDEYDEELCGGVFTTCNEPGSVPEPKSFD